MAESEYAAIVVCDAGPLIHLEELRCLDLLADFEAVWVPAAVWDEVQRHQPSAFRKKKIRFLRAVILPEALPELLTLLRVYPLDEGEMEALRLMQQLPEATLLTDDAAARSIAHELHYDVHGTVGIIVRALPRKQRSKRQVLRLLRSISRRSTLHIAAHLLKAIIEQVEQST